MFLLDTDILIDLLRRYPPAVTWFNTLTETPAVPSLAVMELIQGCANADDLRTVNTLIRPLQKVWLTETDCQKALADFNRFYLSHNIGLIDTLISACSIRLGAELCRFNEKHYKMITDVVLTQPYTRS
jgi:predicted nucleic acid-binding protein